MKQLPLPIALDIERTFDNFIAGSNEQALTQLRTLGRTGAPVYLWGTSGAGKTHLLQAMAARVQQQGGRVGWFDLARGLPWTFEEDMELVVLDECERFDAERQHAAFTLFVDATTHGIAIATGGRLPPVDLPLRDDLRTRLGWGHVIALRSLSEAETRAALRRDADQRGLFLSDDVMDYLLNRFARDLKNLTALLDRLDEFSLVAKRTVTVPLVRRMLAETPRDSFSVRPERG